MPTLGIIVSGRRESAFRRALQHAYEDWTGDAWTAPVLEITCPFCAPVACQPDETFSESLQDCARRLMSAGAEGIALEHLDWHRFACDVEVASAVPLVDPFQALLVELEGRAIVPPATVAFVGPRGWIAAQLTQHGFRSTETTRTAALQGTPALSLLDKFPSGGEVAIVVDSVETGNARRNRFQEPDLIDLTKLHAEACVRWMASEHVR